MCSSRKYLYPSREGFFILTLHHFRISIPEGFGEDPLLSGISVFFFYPPGKLTVHTVVINSFYFLFIVEKIFAGAFFAEHEKYYKD